MSSESRTQAFMRGAKQVMGHPAAARPAASLRWPEANQRPRRSTLVAAIGMAGAWRVGTTSSVAASISVMTGMSQSAASGFTNHIASAAVTSMSSVGCWGAVCPCCRRRRWGRLWASEASESANLDTAVRSAQPMKPGAGEEDEAGGAAGVVEVARG